MSDPVETTAAPLSAAPLSAAAARVLLHGPPGAPVHEVGVELARRWGVPCRGTDQLIEARFAAPIAEVFVSLGESAFRDAEAEATRGVLAEARSGLVVVLGSGVATQPELAELLVGQPDPVVLIEVSLSEAARRLGLAAGPPGLGSPRSSWQRMMTERRSAYLRVSTHRVGADGAPVTVLADRVEQILSEAGTASANSAGADHDAVDHEALDQGSPGSETAGEYR